jgi:gliding motility-associated-like protein
MILNKVYFSYYVYFLISLFFYNTLYAQKQCSFQLENADFENPKILDSWGFVDENKIPGWKTTAPDNLIEVWQSKLLGVPAYSGNQFIEINASFAASVYNDATTVPGSTITFGFAHRGRQGTDVIELKIGPIGGPYISKGLFSTNNIVWNFYTIKYTVPVGQSKTRFIFEAVSSVGGQTIGNFLDNIDVIDIDIEMNVKGSSFCGENKGKIEITGTKPEGVDLEYSIDNINFQKSNIFENLPIGNYIVYMKANGICINNKNVTIPPSQKINIDLGGDKEICEGESVILDAKNLGAKYLWSTGETTQTIEVKNSNTYQVEVIDNNGCIGKNEVKITVHQNPKVFIGADTSFCEAEKLTLDAKIHAGEYIWSNAQKTKQISIDQSGEYWVTFTDNKGCKGHDTIFVDMHPKPIFNLGNDLKICKGESIVLNPHIIANLYEWSTGENTQTIEVNNTGLYNLTVTNEFNCKAFDEIIILPKILVNLGKDTIICKGTKLILNAKNIGLTYLWNTGENSQTITIDKPNLYSVTVSDGKGCSVSDEIYVELDSIVNPYVNFDTTLCQGKFLTLKNLDKSYQLNWLNSQNDEIKVNSSGLFKAILSNNLCKDTFEVKVNIIDSVKGSIQLPNNNNMYCFNIEKASLTVMVENFSNYSLIWSHNLSRENEIEINASGTYTAEVSNGFCTSMISTKIIEHCEPTFFIPNSFTPNNDELNDYFSPKQSGYFNDYSMEIFNRWGELIYISNDINKGWDGKMEGNDVQIDVYVYKIYYSYFNESDILLQKNKVGTVTLYR